MDVYKLCEGCRRGERQPRRFWRCTSCGAQGCVHLGREGGRLGTPIRCLDCVRGAPPADLSALVGMSVDWYPSAAALGIRNAPKVRR